MNIFKNWREPMSALTHLIAILFIFPITIFLMYLGHKEGGSHYLLSFIIFGISIWVLDLASTT